MGFFSSAWNAYEVGKEYEGAFKAAIDSFKAGDALPDVIRAFAAKTEGTYDDAAADLLEKELRQGIEWAQQAATIAGKVAFAIEDHGPAVYDAAKKALAWLDKNAEQVGHTAAAAGVTAVKVSARLDALLRPRDA